MTQRNGTGGRGRGDRGAPTGRDGRFGSGRAGGDSRGARGSGSSRPTGSRQAGSRERTSEQAAYDGPDLPADVSGQELDRKIAAQLRGLPERLAMRVARHLVAAGRALDTDPELAYQHAKAARVRASRIAVVREAAGETAYEAGHFAEALSELRAAKRMNGSADYLPVMADCERALGRPERALELAKSPSVAKLPRALQVEMTMVEAGARFDLGEVDSALRTLENGPLRTDSREAWAVRLRYAYAEMLLRAGRHDAALEWFHRTAGIDGAGITDAAERILELDGVGVIESSDED